MNVNFSQVMHQFSNEQVAAVQDQHSEYGGNIAKSVERLRQVREDCQTWATVDLKLSRVATGASKQFKTRIHSADPFNRSYCTPTTPAQKQDEARRLNQQSHKWVKDVLKLGGNTASHQVAPCMKTGPAVRTQSAKYNPVSHIKEAIRFNPTFYVPESISKMNMTKQTVDFINQTPSKQLNLLVKAYGSTPVKESNG